MRDDLGASAIMGGVSIGRVLRLGTELRPKSLATPSAGALQHESLHYRDPPERVVDNHFSDLVRYGTDVQRDYGQRVHQMVGRVSTWALVGNGAALLLCFSAFIDKKLCSWSVAQPYAIWFLLGMTAAVGSVVFDMAHLNRAEATMIRLVGAARRGGAAADEFQKATQALLHTAGEQRDQIEAHRAANEGQAQEAVAEIETAMKPDTIGLKMFRASQALLASSILILGTSMMCAASSGAIVAARCN